MKRITAVILALAILVLTSSCSAKKRTYKVDLIVKSVNSEFWKSVHEGAVAAGNEFNLEINFMGPKEEKDYRKQVSYIKDAQQNGCDAIILAAADYNTMAAPMEQAVDSGIPVILVDSSVNSKKWISSVSTDNYEAGRTLAEQMVNRLPKNTKIGVIGFVKNASPGIERQKGFEDYIREHSTLQIAETLYCDSDFDIAAKQAQEILEKHPEVKAIAGLNAQSATGAARALSTLKRSDVFLGSIDCTVEEADYMDQDILDVAVLQNPYMMGYYSIETVYKVLNNQPYQKNIYTDVCVVDKNTMLSMKNEQLIFPFE